MLPAEQAAGHSPLDEKQAPTAPIVVCIQSAVAASWESRVFMQDVGVSRRLPLHARGREIGVEVAQPVTKKRGQQDVTLLQSCQRKMIIIDSDHIHEGAPPPGIRLGSNYGCQLLFVPSGGWC